jgi:outer membrane protein assembly factor BamA
MFEIEMNNKLIVIRIYLFALFVLAYYPSYSQVHTDTLTAEQTKELEKKLNDELNKTQKKTSFQIVPVVYYTPETKWAFGVLGIYTFKFNSNDSLLKPSQIVPSFVYTTNKQMLASVRYELNVNKKWLLRGKLGYYIYPYFFSGIGNEHDGGFKEWYDAEYPFFEIDTYRKLSKSKLAVGVKYHYQNTKISSPPDSILNANIPGVHGSTMSALGLGINYDSRDYLLSPTKGWYGDFSVLWSDKNFGSSYQDPYLKFDFRKYIPLFKKKDVFALQVYSEIHSGDVPFNLMAMLGGSRRMRGYQQGIYRDRQMMVYQAEYRSRMFFRYLGFTAFGSYGGIGNDFAEVNKNYRYAYGVGLRLAPIPDKRYYIRLDYGIGKNTQGFYIEVGEAF